MASVAILVAVAATSLSIWKAERRLLRLLVVLVHFAILARCCILIANVGRNTFEHVEKTQRQSDTFGEGVFAEAKAAEEFTRKQLPTVYVVTICMGILALWPGRPARKSCDAREAARPSRA